MQPDDIVDVMAQHESHWMSLDGVEGIAIGESGGGEPIILIYVNPAARENLKNRIPSRVDGYEVSLEPEDGFVAL